MSQTTLKQFEKFTLQQNQLDKINGGEVVTYTFGHESAHMF